MFRTGSAVCSRAGVFAKPLSSGLSKTFLSLADGGSGHLNPTNLLPRLCSSWASSTASVQNLKRGTNPFNRNLAHHNRRLSNMASTKEYRLLCLENPLLDIQAFGNDALLEKYNLKANDAILAEAKHQEIFEDLLNNYDAKLIAGGAAQNTARGAQYLLPENSVVYLGGAGDDKYAAILRDACKQAGLRVEYRIDPKIPTGRCGVVITGHNRSMCTELGAANHYDLEHLKRPDVWALVENAEAYYVGGYHFTVCPPAIMELAKQAVAGNKPFILSLSAPFIPQFFKEPLDASAPYWDYVIGNETEAEAYAESHGLGTKDVKEIAKALANLPKENKQRKRVAIITQGTEPTIVAVQGEDEVKEYPVHAIPKEEIYDTNGAGDAFAGGFCAGIVEGRSLAECVDMGQWLARLSIKELGPS
ncbi:adenosine kinase [Collariella sp. IMI 366227]|nr:adenosine kinase [Collariella sp. IMI 366227]